MIIPIWTMTSLIWTVHVFEICDKPMSYAHITEKSHAKFTEKVVDARLLNHINGHALTPYFDQLRQSANRPYRSTE